MGGDVASLAAEMTPYLSAAVGAYGGAVLARVRDDAADARLVWAVAYCDGCSGPGTRGSRYPNRSQNWPRIQAMMTR
jgi:hypothetical protein